MTSITSNCQNDTQEGKLILVSYYVDAPQVTLPMKIHIHDGMKMDSAVCFSHEQLIDINTTQDLKDVYLSGIRNRNNSIHSVESLYSGVNKNIGYYEKILESKDDEIRNLKSTIKAKDEEYDLLDIKYASSYESEKEIGNQKKIADYKFKIAKRDRTIAIIIAIIATGVNFLH